jgi:SHS2 domain-containing protein
MVEAVEALVACFADVSDATPGRVVPFLFPPDRDDQQLSDLLAECMSVIEIFGVVPVSTYVDRVEDGSLAGCFDTADVAQVRLISGPPEGVRLHGLEFEQTDGWHCLVGIDR